MLYDLEADWTVADLPFAFPPTNYLAKRLAATYIMRAIDSARFPAVIENIIKYASPATLCAFRGTSKYYRAKVDSLLQHLVVDIAEVIPSALRQVSVSSRAGALESTFLRPDTFRLTWEEAMEIAAKDRTALEPLLSQAAVLDLQGPLTYNLPPRPEGMRRDNGDWWLHLEPKKPTNRIVRVVGDSLGRVPKVQRITARTVVYFSGAAAPGPGEEPPMLVHAEPCQEVPKIVVNIPIRDQRFYSEDGHITLRMGFSAGSYLREVVYVFQQVDEEGDVLPPQSEYASKSNSKRAAVPDISDDQGWLNVFDSLSEVLTYAQPKMTFVGLPARFYMGGSLIDPAACLREKIEHYAESECLWDFVKKRVRFLSLPEYIGGPDAQLETSFPGWPKRFPRAIKDATRMVKNPLFGSLVEHPYHQ